MNKQNLSEELLLLLTRKRNYQAAIQILDEKSGY